MLALPAVLTALTLVPALGAHAAGIVTARDSSLPAGITCANGASPMVIGPAYVTGGDSVRCMAVGKPANGAPVVLVNCALTNDIYGDWCIADGPNPSIQLAGTPYCLDAGTGPHDNGPAKLWECQSGLEQQSWTYDATYPNYTISITGGTQCLDRPNGTGLHLQTYTCTSANINYNQLWSVLPSQWFISSQYRK